MKKEYKKYLQEVDDVGFCYDINDIKRILNKKEFEKFVKWFDGQTGLIGDNGELLVFEWDFERFISGLPCVD